MVNTFQQILDDPSLPRAFLIEVQPWDNSITSVVKIGFGDSNAPADPLHYDGFFWTPKIKRIFTSQLAPLSANLTLSSANAPQVGQVDLLIGDSASVPDSAGTVRDLRDLEYDGRQIRILLGDPKGAIGDFGEILNGTMEDVQWTDQIFSFNVANRTNILDTPVQENTYLGDGTEAEGNADLKGQLKPLLYGIKRNFEPVLLDEGRQVYALHEGSIDSVLGVFDRGSALTNEGDIVALSLPALRNWTPEGGKFITDLAGGNIRLGATPDGPLTVDAQGDDTGGFVKKAGEIIERILLTKGPLVAGDIDAATLATFNTDRAGDAGVFLLGGRRILALLQVWTEGLGAIWFFDRAGKFQLKVLKFSTSVATIEDKDLVGSPKRVQTAPPVWQVRTGFKTLGIEQDLGSLELPKQAASEPFNLLGANANSTQVGEFLYYDKKLLSDFDGGVPEQLSFGVWFLDPTANVTNMRVEILFFDGADAQVGSTAQGNFVNTAATLVRSVVEAVAVPGSAVKVTVRTEGDTNFADVDNSFAMFNRGPIALPFVPAQGELGGADVTTADKVTFVAGGATVESLKPAEISSTSGAPFGTDVAGENAGSIANDSKIALRMLDDSVQVDLASDPFLDTGDLCWEVWIKFEAATFPDVTTNWELLANETFEAGGQLFRVNDTTAKLRFRTSQTGASTAVDSNTGLVNHRWYHVAAVRESGVITFYLDGDDDGGGAVTAPVMGGAEGNPRIHDRGKGAMRMRDARVWSGARTQQQIKDNMHALVDGTAGLVNRWLFDEGVGSTVADSVSTAEGTIAGTAFEWVGQGKQITDRIDAALGFGGTIRADIRQEQSDGGTLRTFPLGMASGFAFDGDTFTFSPTRQDIPHVQFGAGGRNTTAGLSGETYPRFRAINLSVSGFTAELLVLEIVGGGTLRTDTGQETGGTQDFEMDKSQVAEAFDDQYNFQWDWRVNGGGTPSEPEPGSVTMGIFTAATAGVWIQRGTKVLNGVDDTDTVKLNDTKTVTVDGLGQHAGNEFGISVVSTSGTGGSLDAFDSVKYTTATAPSSITATPTDVPAVPFRVFSGDEGTVE